MCVSIDSDSQEPDDKEVFAVGFLPDAKDAAARMRQRSSNVSDSGTEWA
jgi:hypothetical protein